MPSPGSTHGCVIFVKLRQFRKDDRQHVNKHPQAQVWERGEPSDGVEYTHLHEDLYERVRLERREAGCQTHEYLPHGAELLVMNGKITCDIAGVSEPLLPWSWLRLPAGSDLVLCAQAQNTCVWIKRHLKPTVEG